MTQERTQSDQKANARSRIHHGAPGRARVVGRARVRRCAADHPAGGGAEDWIVERSVWPL